MSIILRIVALLGAALFAWIGTGFLIDPTGAAEGFALEASGTHGVSTIRGDMAAFFLVGALGLAWGAIRRAAVPLVFAAALFGIALTGRTINLVQMGSYEGWWMPMTVEAITVVVSVLAAVVLPRASNDEAIDA